MNGNKKKEYIQKRLFTTFFIASLFASLAFQINSLVDGIIVSHFVSPDAISAIGFVGPFINFLLLAGVIVFGGAMILIPKMVGAQNYRDASRVGIICFTSLFFFYLFISLIFSIWPYEIVSSFIDDPRLLPFILEYLPIIIFSLVLTVPKSVIEILVKTAGKPIMATRSAVVQCIVNLVLDFLFVVFFKWGISGAAWASFFSVFISILVYIPYLVGKDNVFSWQTPQISWYYPMMVSTVSGGLPLGVTSAVFAILLASINSCFHSTCGADGVFVVTVTLQMLSICMLFLSASICSIFTLGGIFIGEKDFDGYRSFVCARLKRAVFFVVLLSIIMATLSGFISRIFGASPDLLQKIRVPLRWMCLIFVPYSFCYLLSSSLIVLGHKKLATFEYILLLLCNIPILFFVSKYCPQYIWLSLPIGMWLMLLLVFLCNWLVSLRNKDLQWLTLIPKYPNDPSVERSVSFDKADLGRVLGELCTFINICELPERMSNNIIQCIEELSCNIIDMALKTNRKGYFDIRVVEEIDNIFVVIRDDNRPYNPVFPFKLNNGTIVEDEKIGLAIVNFLCKDIKYSYMNGVNCTYMRFIKPESTISNK